MAEVFSTVPVRTDVDGAVVVGIASGQSVGITGSVAITSATALDVSVVDPLPTGTNTIGNVGITGTPNVNITNSSLDVAVTSPLPTGSNTIGAVTISGTPSVNANITNSSLNVAVTSALPTGSNTIGAVTISGTPSVDATIVAALPAGTNLIGKVEVVNSSGTIVQEVVATVTDITKNGGTQTLNSTAIPNGKKGELRQIIVGAGVAMKLTVRKDNTVTPVNAAVGYIPAGGGTIDMSFINEAVVLNGTAAGENFDVVLINLDKVNDAPASVTFVYSLEP